MTLSDVYLDLLERHGPQGWWPLRAQRDASAAAGSLLARGYHPGRYAPPTSPQGCFEIAVGAILTQNTAWTNVERALENLAVLEALSCEALLSCPLPELAQAIRPSGYYNTKARKLRELAGFLQPILKRDDWKTRPPSRAALLEVWGIGPETADSIRVYAFGCLEMVVDTYTRRILHAHGFCPEDITYAPLKALCEAAIPATIEDYQEFHALMVCEGKNRSRNRNFL